MKYILIILLGLSPFLAAQESKYGVGLTIIDQSQFNQEHPYKITLIAKGSEAEYKGLKVNDIILSVHDKGGKVLKESTKCTLKDLAFAITGAKGSEFQIKILRKSTSQTKVFTLKRTKEIKLN